MFIIDNKLVVFWLNLLLEYLSKNPIGMAPIKILNLMVVDIINL